MATSQKLLTAAQSDSLKKIAASETAYSKQAAALLAIHTGATHADAATTSGLSLNQVQYWLKKFRTQGLKALPESAETTNVAAAEAEPAEGKVKKSKKTKKVKDKAAAKEKDAKKKDKKAKKDKDKKSEKKTKKKTKDKKKSK